MDLQTNHVGSLEYLTASALQGTAHCFSTRFGGVSTGDLASLNLGVHRRDVYANVVENYARLGKAVGFLPEQTVFTSQIHSDIVERVGCGECGRGLLRPVDHGVDGLITNETGVALTVFSADCTPILFFDPQKRVIGAVHAGWRGTAAKIATKAVAAMQEQFGCRPEAIRAAIGPCIGSCCFETDGDVPDAMRRAMGAAAAPAITQTGEKYHVDLKLLNAIQLEQAGIRQIDIAKACTACQPQRFWSHRRVGDRRGSLAAIIMLQGESL